MAESISGSGAASTISGIPRGQLLERLRWRYATKQFDPSRRISAPDWTALEEALVLSPSSFGLQPWRFVVVTDRPIKERLVAASWTQRQPAGCSHLVVFAVRTEIGEQDIDAHLDRVAAVRGVSRESLKGYREMMVGSLIAGLDDVSRQGWAARQVYIALGNFLTSAALLGIDACPMEGIDPRQYDEILGLAGQGYTTLVVAAAGYRSAEDKYAAAAKVRYEADEVIRRIESGGELGAQADSQTGRDA